MSFSTEAELSVMVDQSSLRSARRDIEDGLGDVTVGVSASGGGARADGGTAGMGRMQRREFRWARQRTQHLEDVVTLLEDIAEDLDNASGGLLGGGGGGGGLGGILPVGAGGAAGGATAAAAGKVGTAGAVGAGVGVGLVGVRALSESGFLKNVREFGQASSDLIPFGEQLGEVAQFLPGQSVAATLEPLSQLDFEGAANRFVETWERRFQTVQNIADAGAEFGNAISSDAQYNPTRGRDTMTVDQDRLPGTGDDGMQAGPTQAISEGIQRGGGAGADIIRGATEATGTTELVNDITVELRSDYQIQNEVDSQKLADEAVKEVRNEFEGDLDDLRGEIERAVSDRSFGL